MLVNEMFCSIQGEGRYTGVPAFFVRLQGCPVHCSFCDTTKSWNPYEKHTLEMTPEEIGETIMSARQTYPGTRAVVITGGEPFYGQNGQELVDLVHVIQRKCACIVNIETSGEIYPDERFRHLSNGRPVSVVVSPKYEEGAEEFHPCLFQVDRDARDVLVDLKFLVDGTPQAETRINRFMDRYAEILRPGWQYIQPIYWVDNKQENYKCREQAVELAKKLGWTVSCQIHKFLQIP